VTKPEILQCAEKDPFPSKILWPTPNSLFVIHFIIFSSRSLIIFIFGCHVGVGKWQLKSRFSNEAEF
jgi:hypothetical protein